MTFNIPGIRRPSRKRLAALVFIIAATMVVLAQGPKDPSIFLGTACTFPVKSPYPYSAAPGETVNTHIPVKAAAGYTLTDVFWELAPSPALGCDANPPGSQHSIECGPNSMGSDHVFDVVAPSTQVSGANPAGWVHVTSIPLTAEHLGRQGTFGVTVAEAPDADPACAPWNYLLRVVSNGSGWGDPHLTTVNGVHYDFQSAGEFTALREKDFELQTRQAAVPTTSLPSANPYTGLATCVAIYTAVAVRVGSNRITLQPNLSGRPDPSGLQLRVNGRLVTLPEQGIDLPPREGDPTREPEARIVRAAGSGIEIVDWRGTQVVVTPAWWASQQTWYLDVQVYQTSAILGTMGLIPKGSWLPTLPDGTPFGVQPGPLDRRYQELYEKFADAWRVDATTSLFDYAAGQTTKDFTLDEWPRFSPTTCQIQGQQPAPPATPQAAASACAGIADPVRRADCVFDVTFTGHTGFAEAYKNALRFKPRGPGWQAPLKAQSRKPWWRRLIFWDRDGQ